MCSHHITQPFYCQGELKKAQDELLALPSVFASNLLFLYWRWTLVIFSCWPKEKCIISSTKEPRSYLECYCCPKEWTGETNSVLLHAIPLLVAVFCLDRWQALVNCFLVGPHRWTKITYIEKRATWLHHCHISGTLSKLTGNPKISVWKHHPKGVI